MLKIMISVMKSLALKHSMIATSTALSSCAVKVCGLVEAGAITAYQLPSLKAVMDAIKF